MGKALEAVEGMARVMTADTDELAAELRVPKLRALRFKLDVTAALAALTHAEPGGAAHKPCFPAMGEYL